MKSAFFYNKQDMNRAFLVVNKDPGVADDVFVEQMTRRGREEMRERKIPVLVIESDDGKNSWTLA